MINKLLFIVLLSVLTVSIKAQTNYNTLNYLYDISGKKCIAGQQNRSYWDAMKTVSGQNAGLWGEDFSFYNWGGTGSMHEWRTLITNEAKARWKEGAVVAFTFHGCPPTMGEPCDWSNVTGRLSDSEWNDLITDGSQINKNWKARLDVIASYLQDLENSGVEVLFRPFHEMNHPYVFWWANRPGPNGSSRLYQITRDYLVNTKGLSNLIFVWNVQDFGTLSSDLNNYDPGSANWDVLSLDMYNSDGQNYSTAKYQAILNKAGNKPIGIGECEVLPTKEILQAQPRWAYFMGWAELTQQKNTNAQLSDVYNATNVVTLNEMPGWNPVPNSLSKGKPVTVSSTEAGANVASNAVDGSYSTRWSSLYTDAQWLTVDLGANYNVNRVKITWEAAYGRDYTIQYSTDGTTWSTIKAITGNNTLVNDHTGLTGAARYVRMNGTARGTVYGYSIYELEVYGTTANVNQPPTVAITAPSNNATFTAPATLSISSNASDSDGSIAKVDFYNGTTLLGSDNTAPYTFSWANVAAGTYSLTVRATDDRGAVATSAAVNVTVTAIVTVPANLATGKQVTVSSTEAGLNMASNSVDGQYGTRWSSAYTNAEWLTVDLGSNFNVNRVKITWEAAYGRDYRIIGSADGMTWVTLKTITGNTTLSNDFTGLTGMYRFISINGSARGTVYGYSIYELEVYGSPITSVNQAPSVFLTSPVNSTVNAPASIIISANASDSDGSIAKVDFYNGSALLYSDATSPYSYTWTNLVAGTYTITAKATDNSGAVTTSSAVSVNVANVVTNACTSLVQYVESGNYTAGSKVKNNNRQYECKPYPYSGWCNGAAWAYGPGSGAYWSDAWLDKGTCASRSSDDRSAIESSELLILSPNPTSDYIMFNTNKSTKVRVLDAQGFEVIAYRAMEPNASLSLKDIPSGLYYIQIDTGSEFLTRVIVKL